MPRGIAHLHPHLPALTASLPSPRPQPPAFGSPAPAHPDPPAPPPGKFETLYKEFLPLLPSLLPALIRAHARAPSKAQSDVLLELCLTLPARLSALLPFLHELMGPVLHALRAGTEQVKQSYWGRWGGLG